MTGYLLIVYLLVGAAVGTEVALRMRDYVLKDHVEFMPDGEDMAAIVAAGALWPLTVVALGWLKFYGWREERGRGPQGEG